ncbi:hypothetical protein B5S28_g2372 [[Candida] boidinii]|nr:hypothetical protein B5S28_g2372 [[Candida] boidinii]
MFSQHNYNKASMRKIVNSLRLNDIKEKYYSESIKYLNSKLKNSKIGKYENIDSDNIIINKSNQSDNLKTRHKVSKWFKNLLGFETEPNSDLKNRDKFSSKNKEQDEFLSSFDPIELDIQSASFTPFATLLGNCHDKPVITVQNLMTTYFDKKRDKATQIQKEIRLQQLQKELELMHNNDDMNNLTETQELNAFHQSEINPDLETALLNEIETSNQIEIGGEGGDMFDYFNEFSGHFTQTYIDQDSESIKSVEDNKSLDADINPVTTALESKTGEDKLLLEGLNKGLLDVVLQERTTAHENIKNSNDKNITKFETEDLQNNINEDNQENGNQNKLDTLPENSIHNFVEPDALDWNLNAFDAAINSQHLSKEIFVDDKVYDQLLNDLYQLENKEVRPQSRFSVNSKPRIDYNPYPNIYDHHNENRAYLPHQYYRNQPVLNENDFFKNKNSFRVEIDGFDNLSVASLSLTVSRPVKPLEYTYTNTKINKNHQRNLKNIEPSKFFEFNYNSLKHIPQVEKLEKSLRDCSNRLNHQNYQSGFRKTQNAVHDPVLGFLDENKKNDCGKNNPFLRFLIQ